MNAAATVRAYLAAMEARDLAAAQARCRFPVWLPYRVRPRFRVSRAITDK